jgi:hypothetical protein
LQDGKDAARPRARNVIMIFDDSTSLVRSPTSSLYPVIAYLVFLAKQVQLFDESLCPTQLPFLVAPHIYTLISNTCGNHFDPTVFFRVLA